MAVSPIDAARRLRGAAIDGRLEALAELHDLSLVVMFGSASRDQPDARDLGQHALVPGEPLYEYRPGEFARQQMRASGQRLGTEWMRRLDLALMAGSTRQGRRSLAE